MSTCITPIADRDSTVYSIGSDEGYSRSIYSVVGISISGISSSVHSSTCSRYSEVLTVWSIQSGSTIRTVCSEGQ